MTSICNRYSSSFSAYDLERAEKVLSTFPEHLSTFLFLVEVLLALVCPCIFSYILLRLEKVLIEHKVFIFKPSSFLDIAVALTLRETLDAYPRKCYIRKIKLYFFRQKDGMLKGQDSTRGNSLLYTFEKLYRINESN